MLMDISRHECIFDLFLHEMHRKMSTKMCAFTHIFFACTAIMCGLNVDVIVVLHTCGPTHYIFLFVVKNHAINKNFKVGWVKQFIRSTW